MKHRLFIETKAKTGRKVDPPRSWWYCSCGAGDIDLTSPDDAHHAANIHLDGVAKAKLAKGNG